MYIFWSVNIVCFFQNVHVVKFTRLVPNHNYLLCVLQYSEKRNKLVLYQLTGNLSFIEVKQFFTLF